MNEVTVNVVTTNNRQSMANWTRTSDLFSFIRFSFSSSSSLQNAHATSFPTVALLVLVGYSGSEKMHFLHSRTISLVWFVFTVSFSFHFLSTSRWSVHIALREHSTHDGHFNKREWYSMTLVCDTQKEKRSASHCPMKKKEMKRRVERYRWTVHSLCLVLVLF